MANPINQAEAHLIRITDDQYIAQRGDTHFAVIIREPGDDRFS